MVSFGKIAISDMIALKHWQTPLSTRLMTWKAIEPEWNQSFQSGYGLSVVWPKKDEQLKTSHIWIFYQNLWTWKKILFFNLQTFKWPTGEIKPYKFR